MENKNEVQERAQVNVQVNVQVNTQKSVPESAKVNENKRALLVISFGTSYPENSIFRCGYGDFPGEHRGSLCRCGGEDR